MDGRTLPDGKLFHAPLNNNSLCTAIKASFYPNRWAISKKTAVWLDSESAPNIDGELLVKIR